MNRGRQQWHRSVPLLALVLLLAPAWAGAQGLTARAIDRFIRTQVDSGFSGVVLVTKDDSIVLRHAYGRSSRPVTPNSAFWIASITKSFTAAAILSLREQHRLSLHDSIARFFPNCPTEKRDITIEQLLTHTAGFGATYSGGGLRDRATAIDAILSQPLAYQPGHGYRYGDDDYELLAAVLEIVRGQPWQEVILRELLEPLGLRHTGFWCGSSARAAGRRTSLCGAGGADWGHRGANGMSSTADDLLRWARALHRREIPALREIEVPHRLVRKEGSLDVAYGYGVRLYLKGGRVVEAMHSGNGDQGQSAVVRELASGMIIVVLSDSGAHEGTTWSAFLATRLAPRDP